MEEDYDGWGEQREWWSDGQLKLQLGQDQSISRRGEHHGKGGWMKLERI